MSDEKKQDEKSPLLSTLSIHNWEPDKDLIDEVDEGLDAATGASNPYHQTAMTGIPMR